MKIPVAAFSGLVLLSTPCAAADSPDDQAMAEVLRGFYQAHQQSSQDGIPDPKQRARYEQYISPELDKLLADGELAEDQFAKANKDSPPMVEGDLFSPNFEGVSSFRLGACAARGDSAQCKMLLHYAAAHPRPQDRPVDWVDTVTLVKTPAGWRVDDIAYGGSWDFGNHGTLKGLLKDVVADADK